MKKILTAVILAASFVTASAEEIYNLSLQRSIDIAKDQSYRMQNLRYTLDIAMQNYKVAISNQRTNVSLSATLPKFDANVEQDRSEIRDEENKVIGYNYFFIEKRSLNVSGNLNIEQPLPTNGTISLETGYYTNNYYKDKNRLGGLDFILKLKQPLNALYGFNASRAAIKRAKLDYEQSTKQYKREELDLIYSVSQSYYRMLLLQKRMGIAKLDLERQREASSIATQKYGAGLIREVDALQMEVDLASAESSYDEAVLNMYEQTNSFKDLLGLNAQDSVILVNDLSYELVNIDPELAVSLALDNRLEMREQEINVEQQKLNLKQQKAEGLPTANLEASYGKSGRSNRPLSESFSSSFPIMWDDFGERPSNYMVGLTLKVPIIDWGRNKARVKINEARLQQAMLRQDQTEREIESQVRSLISSINSNLRRLQILEKSVVVAEKSFDITLKRFADGDIDSQALALERNRLNNAYTSHLDAFINYQLSITDLARQTFYDFKTSQPIE